MLVRIFMLNGLILTVWKSVDVRRATPRQSRSHDDDACSTAARLFAAALKSDPSDATAKANLQQALGMLKEEHQR